MTKATDLTGPGATEASRLAQSPVVTMVFEQILAAVHTGELLPGQRISDSALAEKLGVSRTPVREALLRLRGIGVVEASPNRFTRVADVTPTQTAQAFIVWVALYDALLEEVVPIAPDEVVAQLEADHADFLAHVKALAAQPLATANFRFFQRLLPFSSNPALVRAITSVVHIVRLGSMHLPDYIDFAALSLSQSLLIDAVRTRDVAGSRDALRVLRGIRVPID